MSNLSTHTHDAPQGSTVVTSSSVLREFFIIEAGETKFSRQRTKLIEWNVIVCDKPLGIYICGFTLFICGFWNVISFRQA